VATDGWAVVCVSVERRAIEAAGVGFSACGINPRGGVSFCVPAIGLAAPGAPANGAGAGGGRLRWGP
jgi:hypothetical protein